MRKLVLTLTLVLLTSAPVLAQEPAPEPDVHEQMRELVLQIERGLRRVDQLLWSADAPPEGDGTTSLATRLREARERARRAVEDIDRLLEIRHHPHGASGGT